ncbi:hypothetical protein [Pseudoneobacillus sp. C159]
MKKILFILMAMITASLVACSNDQADSKEKEAPINSTATGDKTEESDSDSTDTTTTPSQADLASKLVLENTRLTEVFSINQRIHDDYKDLGPFWVVRGIDAKGRTTEVWVNNGKIYDIQ